MSERLSHHEHESTPETGNETVGERLTERPERHERAEEARIDTEKVRENIEHLEGKSNSEDISKKLHEPIERPADLPPPNAEVRTASMNHYLSKIRHHLPNTSRRFSKFIHNPTINTINEVAAKTIVRPYAILLGALFTCVGSVVYFFHIHNTGYKYNYLVPLLLFVGGVVVDWIIELILKIVVRRKPS